VIVAMHGVPYAGAVTRLRETVEIIRLATSGERIAYDGKYYKIPLPGGQGRPLRLGVPARHIPIYLASLGPKSLELTGELADGWLSAWFLPDHADMYFDPIRAGAARAGRSFEDIDLQVRVLLAFSDDIEPLTELAKTTFAREMGMMGSRTHHFFNDVYRRLGYGELADTAFALWQEGRREEAAALIPEDFAMQAHLLGTDEMVKDQIRRFRDVGVTTLRLHPQGSTPAEKLASVGRLMDLVEAVNRESVVSPV
jgi:alkanesulfonate monooxygenase SsuD/methylene tetrahydromethanopterin reductase-like flavin-dependent oxidoreductase (luciferase family)